MVGQVLIYAIANVWVSKTSLIKSMGKGKSGERVGGECCLKKKVVLTMKRHNSSNTFCLYSKFVFGRTLTS